MTFLAALYSAPAFAHHPLAGMPLQPFAYGILSAVGHPLVGFDHLFFVMTPYGQKTYNPCYKPKDSLPFFTPLLYPPYQKERYHQGSGNKLMMPLASQEA